MDDNNNGFISVSRLKSEAKGALVGLIASMLLLLLFSALMLWISVPLMWASVFSYAASALGAFIGGFVCGVLTGEKGLRVGALTGVICFATVFLTGIIVSRSVPSFATLGISALVTVCAAAFGGVVGVNRK